MDSPGFKLVAGLVPALVPWAVHGLFGTCTIRSIHASVRRFYMDERRPFVGAIWHRHLLFALHYFRRRKIAVMVSRSRDGELVARTIQRLGYRTVRGSSSAGGPEALLEVTRLLRDGWGAAILADGPRGPAGVAKVGCVAASRDSGRPIVPVGCWASPAIRLDNWDGTFIPRPFARIAVAFGSPIQVPPDASRERCEALRGQVAATLDALDAICRSSLDAS